MTTSIFEIFLTIIQVLYAICSLSLLFVAFNSLYSIINYLQVKDQKSVAVLNPGHWPSVTVQLPIYNEKIVIERLLKAITSLDYPRDQFEIQVLDDSTDQTAEMARELVEGYQAQGFNIQYLHREKREGFKAGNISRGLQVASGEFVAIFDADFIPPSDWLKRTVVCFSDPKIGFVQTRLTFHNRYQNTITRMASQVLESHYLIEAVARSGNNLLLNFSGSAGIWRKEALVSSGGWHTDTLAEDLDISIRAYLAGWKGIYLKDVTASSEVPFQIEIYKKQQFRWVKGTVQVWRKYFWQIMKSKLPAKTRFAFVLFYLSYSLSFPLGVFLQILFLPVGFFSPWLVPWLSWTGISLAGPLSLFLISTSEETPSFVERLKTLPAIFLIGAGISLNCSIAVLEGLFTKGGDFYVTPRANGSEKSTMLDKKQYPPKISKMVLGEFAVALYIFFTIVILVPVIGPVILPFSLVSAFGFIGVAVASIVENYTRWKKSRG